MLYSLIAVLLVSAAHALNIGSVATARASRASGIHMAADVGDKFPSSAL